SQSPDGRISLSSLLSAPALIHTALLLLFFHSALLAGSLRLSSLPDGDPDVRSLLHRLSSLPPSSSSSSFSSSPPSPPPPSAARRRTPFIHLTRLGTFDDNGHFTSSSSSDAARRLSAACNTSLLALFLRGNGSIGLQSSFNRVKIRIPDYSPSSPFLFSFPDAADAVGVDDNGDRAPDIRILGRASASILMMSRLSFTFLPSSPPPTPLPSWASFSPTRPPSAPSSSRLWPSTFGSRSPSRRPSIPALGWGCDGSRSSCSGGGPRGTPLSSSCGSGSLPMSETRMCSSCSSSRSSLCLSSSRPR
ncbi:unnamed protein product, partial [Musa acuminata var. zebrina]